MPKARPFDIELPTKGCAKMTPNGDRSLQPRTGSTSAFDHPYFLVRKLGDKIETRGQPSAELGHQLPSTSHSVADGVFASWHWDGTRLVVTNDRYGYYPLFWCSLPGEGIGISPSLVTLVEHGAATVLDVEALAVFFRLGFFVGEDTPFSAIRTVPPNAVFAWENGKLECRGRHPQVREATTLSRDDAIERYIDLFAKAMAKRTPGPGDFAIPISGGRDSRHILLELHRTGFKPTVCVSALDNPPDPNEDPRIAEALCRELRFNYTTVEQQLSSFSAQIRKNRETHFCAASHGWYLALADFVSPQFDCTYDGIAGDVLSQSKFLSPGLDASFRSQKVDAICHALLSRQASGYAGIDRLLKGRLRTAMDPTVATNRLAVEVEKHMNGSNPVASFIFWNRTRREIALAPYSLLTGISRVYAPFLDHDLFDFLTTLPSSMLMDHKFHDDTIARAYPNFAHIPYVDQGAPAADDTRERARFVSEATRTFLLKRPSRLMKNAAPRAKMLAGALSRGRFNPWISPFIIYLDQLESMTEMKR